MDTCAMCGLAINSALTSVICRVSIGALRNVSEGIKKHTPLENERDRKKAISIQLHRSRALPQMYQFNCPIPPISSTSMSDPLFHFIFLCYVFAYNEVIIFIQM